ncbi:MAG: hypothetical protein IKQ80_03520 [Clostridia bacterium]|nr:hypothetical protein [Clostridia bacterium]
MGSLKAMYTWQFTFPGGKLLFMGQEFAMDKAWNVKQSIYKRVFSTYDSLPGQANPAGIGGIPPLTAQWHDCYGYSHMLTYSLRPFETVIIEFAAHEN